MAKILSYLSPLFITVLLFSSCGQFTYKTYSEKPEQNTDDPEPDYSITLNRDFQDYTSFMFIGNRIENFGTYFNTYFNAKENFDDAYEDYESRVLADYSERLDSIYAVPPLSQEAIDKFKKAIETASKVIQYHKSSAYMDDAVLLIGKIYFYLGDYLKAERKFSEFISKLPSSEYHDEAALFLARTQLRLNNETALYRLKDLIDKTKDNSVKALAYQTLAEYYINKKDYESAVADYKKSIEFSSNNEFKAQMQYLIASVLSKKDPHIAAAEYKKVLNFGTSYDLEYYSKLNYTKNLILGKNFDEAAPQLEQLIVKYKDNEQLLSEINLLRARYFEERKEYKKALETFKSVISNYSGSVSASDAAYFIADYYENVLKDYLNAFRFYKFSFEQNAAGHYTVNTNSKINTFKRYFELKTIITGNEIKTDYGDEITKLAKGKTGTENQEEKKQGTEGNIEEKGVPQQKGKGQGQGSQTANLKDEKRLTDSLDNTTAVDSFKIKEEKIAAAQFELAELFIYELNKADSAERYFLDAFSQTQDNEFKGRILFALADLYSKQNRQALAEETLSRVIREFPASPVANASRRLLNLPVEEESSSDIADSIYAEAENKFSSGEYNSALNSFVSIINNYSFSRHYNRSVYAAGWIYENVLTKPDSAYIFYEKVISSNPKSEFARIVAGKVSEYKKINTPNDSITTTDTTVLKKENPKEEKVINPGEINPGEDKSNSNDIKKEDDTDVSKKK